MDETFMLFLNDIPAESQEFVLELDKYLTEKGSKRTIKSAKSGFVTSYSSPKSGKALLNYVFRRNGVKIRVYAGQEYGFLSFLGRKNFAAVRKLVESEIDYADRG